MKCGCLCVCQTWPWCVQIHMQMKTEEEIDLNGLFVLSLLAHMRVHLQPSWQRLEKEDPLSATCDVADQWMKHQINDEENSLLFFCHLQSLFKSQVFNVHCKEAHL